MGRIQRGRWVRGPAAGLLQLFEGGVDQRGHPQRGDAAAQKGHRQQKVDKPPRREDIKQRRPAQQGQQPHRGQQIRRCHSGPVHKGQQRPRVAEAGQQRQPPAAAAAHPQQQQEGGRRQKPRQDIVPHGGPAQPQHGRSPRRQRHQPDGCGLSPVPAEGFEKPGGGPVFLPGGHLVRHREQARRGRPRRHHRQAADQPQDVQDHQVPDRPHQAVEGVIQQV